MLLSFIIQLTSIIALFFLATSSIDEVLSGDVSAAKTHAIIFSILCILLAIYRRHRRNVCARKKMFQIEYGYAERRHVIRTHPAKKAKVSSIQSTEKQPSEFVAVDFETANKHRVSACQIGIVHVKNGEIVETFESLICPIGGHAAQMTRIHGITEEDTADAPTFADIFPKVKKLIHGKSVLSYTAFDRQVFEALLAYYNLSLSFKHFDVCALAQERLVELKNHKLKTVAKVLDVPLENQHSALDDSKACALVYLKLRDK